MKQTAVNDFIFYSELSFQYGLIDSFVLDERILCLYDLLNVELDIINDIFPQQLIEHFFDSEENESEEQVKSENFGAISRKSSSNDNGIIQLYTTAQAGKYCQWLFHDNDVDQNPSIPHGHGIQKTRLRLDPYRRFIFEKNSGLRQIGKEKKKYIVALWNDDDFRNFVLMAIRNFINSGVVGNRYNWRQIRGVINPYRLPRKR